MTSVQRGVAEIWSEVLGIALPGLDDNFFQLGGHSLLITRVVNAIRERYEVAPGLHTFFGAPTVRGMADAIVAAQTKQVEPDLIRQLLDEVEAAGEPQPAAETAERSRTPDRGRTPYDPAPDGQENGAVTAGRRLQNAPRALTAFLATAEAPHEAVLSTLAIPTCDRVDGLQRALKSYLGNAARHGRKLDCVVMDNSSSAATRDAYRTALRGLASTEKAEIFYGGAEEKLDWMERCRAERDIPRNILAFALFGHAEGPYNAANNANTNLLHTVGRLVLCADDDTLADTYVPPDAAEGLAMSSGSPEINWGFRDRSALESVMIRSDHDLLAEHELLLGNSPATYAAALARQGRPLDRHGIPEEVLRDPSRARGRAALSIPSLVGDCGWASPSTYLRFEGDSLDQLTRSEADYRAVRVSRMNARFVNTPTFTRDMTSFMCTFYGADNRRLLLPYLPCTKGNDTLYALLHSIAFPEDFFAYSSVALRHEPVETRRFWDHEILRGASGIDFSYLVAALLEPLRAQGGLSGTDPADRVRELGRHIGDLGRLPAKEFDTLARRQACAFAQRELEVQRSVLATHSGPPSWRRDLGDYLALRVESMKNPDFAVPLDLAVERGTERARELSRLFLRLFGELLVIWPDIVSAAEELAARGHRVGRLVRGA